MARHPFERHLNCSALSGYPCQEVSPLKAVPITKYGARTQDPLQTIDGVRGGSDDDRKGEGAKLIFFCPEWEKGCDMRGGTFQAIVLQGAL